MTCCTKREKESRGEPIQTYAHKFVSINKILLLFLFCFVSTVITFGLDLLTVYNNRFFFRSNSKERPYHVKLYKTLEPYIENDLSFRYNFNSITFCNRRVCIFLRCQWQITFHTNFFFLNFQLCTIDKRRKRSMSQVKLLSTATLYTFDAVSSIVICENSDMEIVKMKRYNAYSRFELSSQNVIELCLLYEFWWILKAHPNTLKFFTPNIISFMWTRKKTKSRSAW